MPPIPGRRGRRTDRPPPMPRIRVITFDLDNTLWNVHPVIAGAERSMADWLEEHIPEVMTLYRDGVTVSGIRAALIAEQPAIAHDISRLREELVYRCICRVGRDAGSARQLARAAFRVFLDARHEVEFFDGALDILERLSRSYTLGSLTNGNADPKRLKLDRYFSFGFSAAAVGAGKPAPAMFEAALNHNGVQASEAVHIGDHPIEDVQAAASVGMHTVWTNGPVQRSMRGRDTAVEPTVEIEQLDELEGAIRHIESL